LFRYFGISEEYRKNARSGIFVGDYHVHYSREVVEGDPLRFTHLIIDCDERKVHYWQEMFHATKGYLAAQCEVIMLHVSLSTRRVTPFPPEIFAKIKSVCEIHAKAPPPENLGHVIRIRRKESL
ncbi:MAG: thioesterase family protein, partial [Alphaproteobacteria bacterium]